LSRCRLGAVRGAKAALSVTTRGSAAGNAPTPLPWEKAFFCHASDYRGGTDRAQNQFQRGIAEGRAKGAAVIGSGSESYSRRQ
jgi:hypothetical protein